MKVVLDLRAVHEGLTGIGRYALNLCLSLQDAGGTLTLEAITTPSGKQLIERQASVRLHVVRSAGPSWDDLTLPDLLRSSRADLYHSPLFLLPSVRACKYVCTVHDVIPVVRPDLTHDSFSQFFHTCIGRAFRAAHHVITVSDHSRSDLLKSFHVDENTVSTIHEPVNPLFAREAGAGDLARLTAHNLTPGYILSVGSLDRRKNLSGLLDAYALLNSEAQAPALVVVGAASGDNFDFSAEVKRRGLSKHVRSLGRVSDDMLAILYTHASLLVFPSFYEGFGLPIVEAMAAGTPVVASNVSSIPEVAGDAALLVDPLDPVALKNAVSRILLESSLREDLVRKGKARAARFSLKNHGENLIRLYERVLSVAS